MSYPPTPWYHEPNIVEPVGRMGRAAHQRFLNVKTGAAVYVYWSWLRGWWCELHDYAGKMKVCLWLKGTKPDAEIPLLPPEVFQQADEISQKWAQG